MTTTDWQTVMRMAEAAASLAPEPFGTVADIALALVRVAMSNGCEVEGCPADVRARAMLPPNLPTGERGQQAMVRAEAAARGLVK